MTGEETTTRTTIAALLLLMGAIGVASTTVIFSLRGRVPFPEPELLTILDEFRRSGLAHALWMPIEGHRMAVPRALQLIDHYVFGGTNLFTFVAVWAMNALAFLWVFTVTTGDLSRDHLLRGAALCLGAILVFGPYYTIYAHGQHANFVVAWFFSIASICSFFVAGRSRRKFNAGHGIAVLLGWIAGLSLLPGLFVWPVQAYLALVQRNGRLLLAVVACSLPIFAVQAAGSQVEGAGQVFTLFADPVRSMAWISRYVGSIFGQALFFDPLSRVSGTVAVSSGLLGLAIAAVFSLWLLWRPRALHPEAPLAVGILLLALLWIVAAAAKHPEGEGLLERYYFVVGWFWFAIVPLMISGMRARIGRIRPLVPLLAPAAILLLGPNYALTSLRVDARGSLFDAAQIAVLAGVDDTQLYTSLHLVPPRDPLWDEMRRRREPPFNSTPLVDRVDAARLRVCAQPDVEVATLPGGGWRLGGDLPTGVRWIFALDDSAEIVGIGRPWRAPIVPQFFPADVSLPRGERWWGYSRLDPTDSKVAVVAFDHAGTPRCRLRGAPS